MQVAHGVDVELVGLGLDGVDLDDQLAQRFGLAVVGKLDHQVFHGAAGVSHLVGDDDMRITLKNLLICLLLLELLINLLISLYWKIGEMKRGGRANV